VVKHDQQSNVRLLPFDQVYVGQSRRSTYAPAMPPWLRPLYNALVGMHRTDGANQPPEGTGVGKSPSSPAPVDRPAAPGRQRDLPRRGTPDSGVVPAE
jgi:hypothetical protein